jgi:hypothetical protein
MGENKDTLSQREIDMLSLNITEDDLVNDKVRVMEKMFCAALCQQNTDIISTVLKDFIEIRDRFYPKNDKNKNDKKCHYYDCYPGKHAWDDSGKCACGAVLKF